MKTFLYTAPATLTALCAASLAGQEKPAQPNILVVVMDDIGFSDLQCYGSEIQTPTINKIAEQGLRYTRFHTCSLSAPTRAMLLTGVDNHQNGEGCMQPLHCENQYIQAGYEGHLNSRVVTMAELLRQHGYATAMAGKWHLGGGKGETPFYHGFERSFSLMAGGAGHFAYHIPLGDEDAPVTFYMEDDKRVTVPEDFYSSTFYADKMIDYIKTTPAEKPFFGYLTFTAAHDPLQAKKDWQDKYKGQYDEGHEALIKARHKRMVELGLIDADTPTDYKTFYERPDWDKMPADEKALEIRRMELYAAMIAYADYSLGRVIEQLKASGRYDNTIIIVIADNGANPHPSDSYGSISGVTLDNSFENLGNGNSFISLGCNWAESCNTPFRYAKTMTGAGGITCPLIIKGLGGKQGSIDRESLVHVTDIFPTLLECTQIERPSSHKGVELAPLYGKSLLDSIASGKPARDETEAICIEMTGGRAVMKGGWKLFSLTDGDKDWQLYNMRHDLAEQHDLATSQPAKYQELLQEWEVYAKKVGYIKGEGDIRATLHRLGPEEFYEYDPANKK